MHASNRSRGRLAAGSIAFAALIAGASLAGCSPDGQAGGQLGSAASELEIMAIGSALPETASSCPPPYPYNPSPSPGGTEEYRALDEPGFLSPATSPLSTLSADVDTASYCNLRRMVAQEYAPAVVPAGAVRTKSCSTTSTTPTRRPLARLVRRIDPDERLSLERPDEAAGHGIRHREGRRRFVRGRQPRVPHRRLGVDGRP